MSKASERKALREALVGYPLMTVNQIASFLSMKPEKVRRLLEARAIPNKDVGLGKNRQYRADPMDVAVYFARLFGHVVPLAPPSKPSIGWWPR